MAELIAGIGLLAKTGRAVAVALAGPSSAPSLLGSDTFSLWPAHFPKVGPYHAVMELPWEQAVAAVAPMAHAVEQLAAESLATLLSSPRLATARRLGLAVVGSLGRDPSDIPNPHIRAHAAEGQLFRRALERAALSHGLRPITFPIKDVFHAASSACGIPPATFQGQVKALGAGTRPWRLEQQAAAAAAWAALS